MVTRVRVGRWGLGELGRKGGGKTVTTVGESSAVVTRVEVDWAEGRVWGN